MAFKRGAKPCFAAPSFKTTYRKSADGQGVEVVREVFKADAGGTGEVRKVKQVLRDGKLVKREVVLQTAVSSSAKPIRYVSEAALSRMIANMQQKQQRILDGKTQREAMPANQFAGMRLSNFPAMVPSWRKL